eukprot:Plantae.Rhodophyta-Rhodochaete_pulchella.ctg593.p1 GENE.Plantae.Rhodophyta-Rhodochaete_pulchella.ctg593~~Plantae.Rhodophyta-Rhodochaete_pulchella.ctg593.p1  ORF type:complete len:390 (+),score=38.89 Plantae.Rhodophyta-Rhodochaete_pulchella.ctg593:1036-2205(+)
MEKEILKRLPGAADPDLEDSSAAPFVWTNGGRTGTRRRTIAHPHQLVIAEVVELFDLSWMVYLGDSAIEKLMQEYSKKSDLRLRSIWREHTRDLTVLIAQSHDTIVVSFRGTVSLSNWAVNINTRLMDHPPLEDPAWLQGKWKPPGVELSRIWNLRDKRPKVHRGFYNAYNTLRHEVLNDISEAVHSCSIDSPRIMCTGHSLGGALALLCAFDLRVSGYSASQVSVLSFGSPKVGNRPFARRCTAVLPNSFRIVNQHDAVTSEPRVLVHHFQHVAREVIFTDKGNAIFDPLYSDVKIIHKNRLGPHLMGEYANRIKRFIDGIAPREMVKPDWFDFTAHELASEAEDKMKSSVKNENIGIDPQRIVATIRRAPLTDEVRPEVIRRVCSLT